MLEKNFLVEVEDPLASTTVGNSEIRADLLVCKLSLDILIYISNKAFCVFLLLKGLQESVANIAIILNREILKNAKF